MNFKQLYYFTVVAEAGSISAAAARLGLSQPPLSRQLAQLEESLKTPLFTRTAHGIQLTDAGRVLYYRAKDILSMMEAAALEVRSFHGGFRGILKIGCISSSGILITRLMEAFIKQYPLITIDLYEGNTYETIEKLKNGLVECAIIRTPFNSDGLDCIYGPEEFLMAVGRPEFFKKESGFSAAGSDGISKDAQSAAKSVSDTSAAEGGSKSCSEEKSSGRQKGIFLADLYGKPLIYYRRFENIIANAFSNAGLRPTILCKNDDARTSLQWATAGLGIALVPENISRLADNDGLEAHPILCEETVTRMTAVCQSGNKNLSKTAQNFLDVFRKLQASPQSAGSQGL